MMDLPQLILILSIAAVAIIGLLIWWAYRADDKKNLLPQLPNSATERNGENNSALPVEPLDNSNFERMLIIHAQNVIHDSKNSISSINRLAEEILDSLTHKHKLADYTINDDFEQKLSSINQSCRRLVEKFEGLQHSLYSTASLALEKSIVDISEVWRKIRKSLESEAKLSGVELTIISTRNNSPATSDLKVEVDRERINEVFTELTRNGIKYADPNKNNPKVSVAFKADEQYVFIHILDNGLGIPDDEADQVFQPRFRGRHAQPIEGTGIGLFTAKVYIEEHGGEITVDNHPKDSWGTGTKWSTEFIIKLPREY